MHPQNILSREEFRKFSRPRPLRMVLDFSLVWGQVILGIAIFAYYFNVVGFLVGMVLVGSAQHGLSQVAHEGVHNLIAPGRKEINDFVARWLFAAPVVLPYSLYRQRHLTHHRHVATDQDTKDLYRRDIRGSRFLLEILSALSGVDYIRQVLFTLRRDKADRGAEVTAALPGWVKQEFPAIAVTQLSLLIALSLINPWLYWLMWALPIVTVSPLASKLRCMVEHRPLAAMMGAKPGSGFYMDTVSPCLRNVEATWIERVFISKVNFHFHAEHHLWSFISYQHLPTLHQRLQLSPPAGDVGYTVEPSYAAALRKLWAGQ